MIDRLSELIIAVFPKVGLIVAIYSILVVSIELLPQQYAETVGRPLDQFTKLRWGILKLLLQIIGALSIPLIYRLVRVFGGDSELLRALASLSSALAVFLFIRTLVFIFRYKYKK